ncbi:MAG TPA: hypothetical protein VKU40_11640 [Thermoanaerobaculia bacterium]|nr:hypothetical protein [Thermoanaerobaculia bacterium]
MSAVREAELYSLPEVSRATGIPLPDLQRLRRDHAEDVPSVVVGEAKRYPDEALAVFRRLHRQEGGDSEALKPVRAPVEPKRALFSIASQRRGAGDRPNGGAGSGSPPAAGEPPAQAKPAPPPAAPPATPAEEVVDPGPPDVFDEMALALGQLGGDDPKAMAPIVPRAKPVGQRSKRSAGSQHRPPESLRRRDERRDERRERRPERREQPPERHENRPEPRAEHDTGDDRPAATAPAPGSLAAAIERVRAAKAAKEHRAQSAALRQGGNEPVPTGEPAAEASNGHAPEATPATETAQTGETGNGHAATNGTEAAGRDAAGKAAASVREPAPEPVIEPVIVRPKPPLYTLQQIHERTGIPYSTLSLLAASHARQIPSAGERYSPAYPLAGLLEFCRIYGEQNPGWEAPPLGPQPGWDDEAGIAARINALAALQSRWSDQLEVEIDRFARPWTGQAEWEV